MKHEYASTLGKCKWGKDPDADDPKPPDDSGEWRLVGTSLGTFCEGDALILWTWERPLPEPLTMAPITPIAPC